MTSDNGANFTSGLWKGVMDKLNIEVKYSASYRPESIGMLERQHRSLKDSIKAAIVDVENSLKSSLLEMAEKHQNK